LKNLYLGKYIELFSLNGNIFHILPLKAVLFQIFHLTTITYLIHRNYEYEFTEYIDQEIIFIEESAYEAIPFFGSDYLISLDCIWEQVY
jgi:hypothetical protein